MEKPFRKAEILRKPNCPRNQSRFEAAFDKVLGRLIKAKPKQRGAKLGSVLIARC